MKKPHCGLQFTAAVAFKCNLHTNNEQFGLKLCDAPKANIFVAKSGTSRHLHHNICLVKVDAPLYAGIFVAVRCVDGILTN